MMTVRFPNGQAVQYNDATFCNRSREYSDLWTKEGGTWIAQIPNTCIIENKPACRVYNPLDRADIDERVAKELRAMRREIAALKRAKA